jgi:hypothetical protein
MNHLNVFKKVYDFQIVAFVRASIVNAVDMKIEEDIIPQQLLKLKEIIDAEVESSASLYDVCQI